MWIPTEVQLWQIVCHFHKGKKRNLQTNVVHWTKDVREQETDMARGTVQSAAIVDSFPSLRSNQPRPNEYTVCLFEILDKYDILFDQSLKNYLNDSSRATYAMIPTDIYLELTTIGKVNDMIPATSGHAMTDDTARTNKQVYLPSGIPRR